jgi:hypothetical protein
MGKFQNCQEKLKACKSIGTNYRKKRKTEECKKEEPGKIIKPYSLEELTRVVGDVDAEIGLLHCLGYGYKWKYYNALFFNKNSG